ncbi:hypothetical protein [Staphylospora marina]|uniref:hypothetical protein n=1 Tax=Staphylospora marina TaxID=2490858 RepID=UPI000F5BF244|nr:hypothetical protein [Staphylospora marina]
MISGVPAILCQSGLVILFLTGWFSDVRHSFGVPARVAAGAVLVSLLLTALDPVSPFPGVALHPGLLVPFLGWMTALLRDRRDISGLLQAGFFIGGMQVVMFGTVPQGGEREWLGGLAVIAVSRLLFRDWRKQLATTSGAIFVSEAWRLLIHRESLSPLPVVSPEFLDRFWLAWFIVFVLHETEEALRALLSGKKRTGSL